MAPPAPPASYTPANISYLNTVICFVIHFLQSMIPLTNIIFVALLILSFLRPGTAADEDYSLPHNGCGPCASDAATDTCVECDTDKCNSNATTITAVLLPLIAVIYSFVM